MTLITVFALGCIGLTQLRLSQQYALVAFLTLVMAVASVAVG